VKLDKNLSKAKLQGIMGAVCTVAMSAAYLAGEAVWIVRLLSLLLALTFFHYALVRIEEAFGQNVFRIFKYAYNGFLAMILCSVALYVFDKDLLGLITSIIPLSVCAASIAWVVINFKLANALDCVLFRVYAWMLSIDFAANFLYGMLEVLAPTLIAPVVKFIPLANALFGLFTASALLFAWISVKFPKTEAE
jgi:hypothetical protein